MLFHGTFKRRADLHASSFRMMVCHDCQVSIRLDGKENIYMIHLWKWVCEIGVAWSLFVRPPF
jgi:hypothetical protein